jgi:putative ABC transport system permease protein
MLKSYFLVAIRNLRRNSLHSTINIVGLAIGMTCCILITLYVQFELSYDRQNKRAEQVYRLTVDLEANNWAISAFPLGQLLKDNMPEVESFTRIKPTEILVQNSVSKIRNKEKIFYADSSVFDVLDIHLIKGDPSTALAGMNAMVLTAEKAKTYFGDADPMGQTLTLLNDTTEYRITGIFEPLPSASHVHINMMVASDNFDPMNPKSKNGWNYLTNHYTYVILPKGTDRIAFEKKISSFLDVKQEVKAGDRKNVLHAQPLTSIHLHSDLGLEAEANGNLNTVYILSAIAFFILIIACINFMNLTTAQSLRRAREVGIRKVVGSKRTQLVFQFLSESVVISCISLALAVVLVAGIMPAFNTMTEKAIILNPIENGKVAAIFLGITAFVGLIAGTYPAFFLSNFKPTAVLKGSFVGNFKGQLLRKSLVVFQFAIAFVIMIGTYVVYDQLNFMLHKNMGFDREQKLILQLPQDSLTQASLKNELLRLSAVQGAAGMLEVPGSMVRTTGIWYEGARDEKNANVYTFSGDPDLINTMGMTMLQGKYFTHETRKYYKEFVINETAARHFGWTTETSVGKMMDFGRRDSIPGVVVGVVKDFHFKHLQEAIDPLVMYLEPNYGGRFMIVSIKSANMKETLAQVENAWKKVSSADFEYKFMDESFERMFDQEKKLGQLFGIFSALAIFISCLGLFGLASFTMEQSRKSVAVRKVMGATAGNIVVMMSRDFLKLVLIGMLLAGPTAWFAMNKWLQGFVYNVGFGWIVFLYAGIAGLLVAFGTVSYHSLKAATSNPVNSLKEQ